MDTNQRCLLYRVYVIPLTAYLLCSDRVTWKYSSPAFQLRSCLHLSSQRNCWRRRQRLHFLLLPLPQTASRLLKHYCSGPIQRTMYKLPTSYIWTILVQPDLGEICQMEMLILELGDQCQASLWPIVLVEPHQMTPRDLFTTALHLIRQISVVQA